MIRGTKTFCCHCCRTKFRAFDIEWRGTKYSQPPCCPQCGSYQTYPYSLFSICPPWAYLKIWKELKKNEDANS
jgi:hypothetical protein